MSSKKDTVTPSAASEHLLGRVKWFNNKAGYGFITVTDGTRSGSDIFVHHSAINVESQQYKYLIQGEYVEFDLVKTETDKHEWQASKVSGIKSGKLMCETRHEVKVSRSEYKSTVKSNETDEVAQPKTPRQRVPRESPQEPTPKPRKNIAARVRGEGPRDSGDNKQWTLVENKTPKPKAKRVQKAKEPTSTA